MNKYLLTISVVLAVSSGAAQASLTAPISGTHMTADAPANSIEAYYVTTDTTGSYDIFLNSTINADGLDMNGFLSVWHQEGNSWQLLGTNNDAAFTPPPVLNQQTPAPNNVYGSQVHQWSYADPTGGISDPGLSLNLTANNNYMIIQSDVSNGPNGTSVAVGSSIQALQSVLEGAYFPGIPAGLWFNSYSLSVNGIGLVSQIAAPQPSAVPLPAAVWLFGSAIAGLGFVGRKKNEGHLTC